MNNCLVTKLKGTVDNDNLPIMGVLDIEIDYTAQNNKYGGFLLNPNQSVEIIGNGYFMDYLGNNIGKTFTFTDDRHNILLSSGTYTLRIHDKYSLTSFVASGGQNIVTVTSKEYDINELFKYTNLKSIYFGYFFKAETPLDIPKLIYDYGLLSINTNSAPLYLSGNFDRSIGYPIYVNLSGGFKYNITGSIMVFDEGLENGSYLRETKMTGEYADLFDVWATKPYMIGKTITTYTNIYTTLNGVTTTEGQMIQVKINNGSWELL